jgi:hypothetical protein
MSNKKTHERYLIEQFRACHPDFPVGEIAHFEGPDFLVRASTGPVGLEVTELLRPSRAGERPRIEQEALRQRVADRARKCYEASGGPPISVALFFSHFQDLNKRDIPGLAEQLAGIALRTPVAMSSSLVLDAGDENPVLPPLVDRMRLARFPVVTESDWVVVDAEYLTPLTHDYLQAVLDAKTARTSDYRRHASTLWLLVVIDGFRISGSFTLPDDLLTRPYRHGFDRVFVFIRAAKQYWELRS